MERYRSPLTFTMTENHLKLVRKMYVQWQDCETGAPEIDPKRPYGNSDVAYDVATILGWEWDRDGDMPEEMATRAIKIHEETPSALQIVLVTGKFEAGEYKRSETYDTRSWKRVS